MVSYLKAATGFAALIATIVGFVTNLFGSKPATPTPIPVTPYATSSQNYPSSEITMTIAASPTPIPGWKTFTHRGVSFQYPPLWKLEATTDNDIYDEGFFLSNQKAKTHDLPLFRVLFYNYKNKYLGTKWDIDQLVNDWNKSYTTVNGYRALQERHDSVSGKGISEMQIAIDIPEQSQYVVFEYLDSQYGDFQEELDLYMKPILGSLSIK